MGNTDTFAKKEGTEDSYDMEIEASSQIRTPPN